MLRTRVPIINDRYSDGVVVDVAVPRDQNLLKSCCCESRRRGHLYWTAVDTFVVSVEESLQLQAVVGRFVTGGFGVEPIWFHTCTSRKPRQSRADQWTQFFFYRNYDAF
jgi:hypothetical protein